MYLSLETIKNHLNIDATFTDDDNYIQHLGEVAELAVERHIDRKLSELCVDGGEGELILPSPITHAMLLLIGNLYANREPVSYASTMQIPLSYDYLLSLYKNYSNEGGVTN